jgi:hypothetical protein
MQMEAFIATILLTLVSAGSDAASQPVAGPDLPGVDQLPATEGLPDPFRFLDGSRVGNREDWKRRRQEIIRILSYYEYGHMPPAPDKLDVQETETKVALDGQASETRVVLSLGPQRQVRIRVGVFAPRGTKRTSFPVLLAVEPVWHDSLKPVARLVVERGYIFAGYDKHDVAKDDPNRSDGVYALYPEYDWGTLAAWAWGGMRVLDYLLTRKDVDRSRIAMTGHSRAGKTALLAGALDERIALVAPHASGAGGAGCYRIMGKGAETLALITHPQRFAYWFHPRLAPFAGKENRLPFDQHFLRALVAPRTVISLEGLGDLWANPLGSKAAYEAAQPVFDFLGASDKNAIYFRPGGHDMTIEDWKALLDFADRVFFGKPTTRKFSTLKRRGLAPAVLEQTAGL